MVRRGVRALPERVLPRDTSTSPALTSAQKQRTCSVFKAAGASQRTQRLVAIALQRPVPVPPRDLRGPEPSAPLLSAFKEVHAAAFALAPQIPGFFPLKLAVLLAYARSIFPVLTDSVFCFFDQTGKPASRCAADVLVSARGGTRRVQSLQGLRAFLSIRSVSEAEDWRGATGANAPERRAVHVLIAGSSSGALA